MCSHPTGAKKNTMPPMVYAFKFLSEFHCFWGVRRAFSVPTDIPNHWSGIEESVHRSVLPRHRLPSPRALGAVSLAAYAGTSTDPPAIAAAAAAAPVTQGAQCQPVSPLCKLPDFMPLTAFFLFS